MLGEPFECFPRADFNTRLNHGVTNLARRMDNCIRKRSLPVFFDEGHRVDGFTSSNDSVDTMRSGRAISRYTPLMPISRASGPRRT